ncbi:hypothetical protein ACFL0V_07110 [Nanoarchaeota archaeon]
MPAKILGILDMLTMIVVILMHYDIFIGWRIGFLFAGYLILKGILFRGDFASIVDIVCGAWMIVMIFGVSIFVTWIVVVWLFQKAVFSLAA